jgi:hypothetical protein
MHGSARSASIIECAVTVIEDPFQDDALVESRARIRHAGSYQGGRLETIT